MALNIGKEIAALKRMTVPELRRRYAHVFDEDSIPSLNGIHGNDGLVIAVGAEGATLHGSGGSWTLQPSGTQTDFWDVWVVDSVNAFAVGEDGIYRWDGTSWSKMSIGFDHPFDSAWGSDTGEVWFGGRMARSCAGDRRTRLISGSKLPVQLTARGTREGRKPKYGWAGGVEMNGSRRRYSRGFTP